MSFTYQIVNLRQLYPIGAAIKAMFLGFFFFFLNVDFNPLFHGFFFLKL